MKWRIAGALFLFLSTNAGQAIILFRTGDPAANTSAPTAPGYADSGWQHQGLWGGFLGTPIAPHFFISATHVGNAGILIFKGPNPSYTVVRGFPDPQSDLTIWKVAEEFPSFAPLYSRVDEMDRRMILIGRGTPRGPAMMLNNVLKGWSWAPGDGVVRWGENFVTGIQPNGPGNDLLSANFDQNGLPNECHLSSGDSGGAAFIEDAGVWKLAGINYAVDGPFYTDSIGSGGFYAALFDVSGYYHHEGGVFLQVPGPAPVPTALYPTRISTKLPWICLTIAEPQIGVEPNFVTLTYTKLLLPETDVKYSVLKSANLILWETASTTDEVISTSGATQVVESKVAIASDTNAFFLRLEVKRP